MSLKASTMKVNGGLVFWMRHGALAVLAPKNTRRINHESSTHVVHWWWIGDRSDRSCDRNGSARQGLVFIAGDRPVTEDQVRQKLQSEGWSDIQIVRDGRYFEAIASKDEQFTKIVVDSQTV